MKYDVAISFAGEDRLIAKELAASLTDRNIKVFYDDYEKASLWGKNLYTHLSDVYQKQSRFCVILLSKHYAKKMWTNHEREAAQARAFFDENQEYILPVRLDDTEIPGILPTVGYLRWPPENSNTISEKIIAKLGHTRESSKQIKVEVNVKQFNGGHVGIIKLQITNMESAPIIIRSLKLTTLKQWDIPDIIRWASLRPIIDWLPENIVSEAVTVSANEGSSTIKYLNIFLDTHCTKEIEIPVLTDHSPIYGYGEFPFLIHAVLKYDDGELLTLPNIMISLNSQAPFITAKHDRCQGSCRLKLNLCRLVFYNLCFLFFRIKMNNSYRFPVSYFATPTVRFFLLRLFVHLLAFSQYSHVFTHMPLSRCDEVD